MTQLWPRLALSEAVSEFSNVEERPARSSHPSQSFSPTGGTRIGAPEVEALARDLRSSAAEFGFPSAPSPAGRVAFDRRAAEIIRRHMDLSWAEASERELWSFLALVPLEDLTNWRFGRNNRERWIASDLTRHTWARLWWQATVFAGAPGLLDALSESDLNQIFERRAIGGDPRLAVALAVSVVEVTIDGDARRAVMRDAAARLLRRLAFVEPHAVSDAQVLQLCRDLVNETRAALAAAG